MAKQIRLETRQQLNIYMSPVRQELMRLLRLAEEPMTPKALADRLGVSPSSVQHHLKKLLELGVIPVVNENDSVSSAEIETGKCKVLGDNDTLSAIVARLCGAGLLVLFSDIDGLYDADPRTHPDARLIHQVEAITPELRAMAGGAGTWRGTGGMATKLNAAQLCLEAGVDMVIANGARMEALYDIVEGKNVGTRFSARRGALQ